MRAHIMISTIFMLAPLSVAGAQDHPSGYDDSWYRGDFWSGEYPDGFSVTSDMTVNIRADTDLSLPRDIACDLKKNATYHVWNVDRVIEDALFFVSYTKITNATLTGDLETTLDPEVNGASIDVSFRKGDAYRYLAYLGEGAFMLDYKGGHYVGYADLLDASNLADPEPAYDEWIGITCPNGTSGWLFMGDVADLPGTEPARVTRYGYALDLDAPEPAYDDVDMGD